MNCKEVEQQIISGEELTTEAQSHLLHCSKCQEFSMLSLLVEGREGMPSAKTDAFCRKLLHKHEPLIPVARYRTRIFASVAAALLVMFGVLAAFRLRVNDAEPVQGNIALAQVKNEPSQVDWLLLADNDLENLELGKEDDKEPIHQLYAEIATMEVEFYDYF